jgi:hypothetical protein
MREKRNVCRAWLGNLKERERLKFLVLDERIIFRWILKIRWKGVEWNSLAPQDGDKWRALVNKIMNIQISPNLRSLVTS